MFAIRSWLMIMSGFFILFCLLWDDNKKVTKNSLAKKGREDVKQLSSRTLQTISVTQLEVLD
jgi:hypothetical protein